MQNPLLLLTFISLYFFTIPPSAATEEVAWVTVEGNSSMENITKEEARRLAIEDAERNAVEQVAGVTVSADTLVSNFTVSSDVISAIPYGKVIEREILTEDIQVIKDETKTRPSSIYHVKLKAKVAKEKGNIDPYFKLEASLNRTVFKDGEEMQLKIKPTRDCYLTIFNILEDDSVLTLIPNRHIRDTFIKADEYLIFPDEGIKKMGINLKVHVVEGKNITKEKIYILCFKQPVDFGNKFEEGLFGIYKGSSAFIKELKREVVDIPLSERAERFLPYEIRKE
ncbi:MAG: DUF4384 domain-containing protein [Nitrospinae bacterium]|nr:DUF4384 domain-containing protein [Nitrospinota bacterium]